MSENNGLNVSLESIRKKLLDLSNRNKFLNFRFPKSKYPKILRVVDEMPNQLFSKLIERNELILDYVPEPLKEDLIIEEYETKDGEKKQKVSKPKPIDYARKQGISVEYDLPEPKEENINAVKHQDNLIQTLYYLEDLEKVAKGIFQAKNTYEQESGTNALNLIFGFLEWYEDINSEEPRLAPLFAIPVDIKKGSLANENGIKSYRYIIESTGEDINSNLTLSEKLNKDFNIILPEIEDGDEPEDYFKRIDNLIKSNPHFKRWKVKRQVCLSLLHFGKFLLYLDLDPEKWTSNGLLTSSTLNQIFGFEDSKSEYSNDVYDIDEDERTKNIPLVMDADSSQISALADAMSGKNLVIEGPPGTGKSQTITNLIAASLLEGKKVLFVSEKLAALEVVKNRLDECGLGKFCLELHSHKTQKQKVLEDIKLRIKSKFPKPQEIANKRRELSNYKKELGNYVRVLNKFNEEYGKTNHQILWETEKYRIELSDYADNLINLRLDLNRDKFSKAYDEISRLQHLQQNIEKESSVELWKGLKIKKREYSQSEFELFLSESIESSQNVINIVSSFLDKEGVNDEEYKLSDYLGIKEVSSRLKEPEESFSYLLPNFLEPSRIELLEEVQNTILKIIEIEENYSFLKYDIQNESYESAKEQYLKLNEAESLLVKSDNTVDLFEKLESKFRDLINRYEKIKEIKGKASQLSGIAFNEKEDLKELKLFFESIKKTPINLFDKRKDSIINEESGQILAETRKKHESLTGKKLELESIFDYKLLPDESDIKKCLIEFKNKNFFSIFSSDFRRADKLFKSSLKTPVKHPNEKKIELLNSIVKLNENEKAFINDDCEKLKSYFNRLVNGLNTNFEEIEKLVDWNAYVENVKKQGIAIDKVDSLNLDLIKKLLDHASDYDSEISQLSSLEEDISNDYEIGKNESLNNTIKSLKVTDKKVSEIKKIIQERVEGNNVPYSSFISSIQSLYNLISLYKSLLDSRAELVKIFGIFPELNSVTLDSLNNSFEYYKTISSLGENLQSYLLSKEHISRYNSFSNLSADIKEHFDGLNSHLTPNENQEVDFELLLGYEKDDLLLTNLEGKFNSIKSSINSFEDWKHICHVREILNDNDEVASFIKSSDKSALPLNLWEIAFKYVYNNSISEKIFEEFPGIKSYSGNDIEHYRNKYREIDEVLVKELNREEIASKVAEKYIPKGNYSSKVKELTDLYLIERELEKKTKHIPIRELVNRAGDALVALKPCFMMGPQSVSQYLKPDNIEFDLIVIDEASQMKVEQAVGAIARAKQVIVVGDPKQLPPTRFFDRIAYDEEDEEGEDIVDGMESILDICSNRFNPTRSLKWHYRSRHENLIAFSNHAFYDSNLVVFPSPANKSDDLGVEFNYLAEGYFESRKNEVEAQMIAKKAVEEMRKNPSSSIGIVAMSMQQQDIIENELEKLMKDDPFAEEFERKRAKGNEPLFVKNLENVQGDERDTIIISMTYGKDRASGKVHQRFGPINSEDGWRRLNVLFTRSKRKMIIFSSMRGEDIRADASSKRGVKALKNFLKFAETGNLPAKESGERLQEPESPFESAVKSILETKGYEVECQIGVSGYFIDLAVRNPENLNEYLVGIECDGATYHSAKSIRDRDKTRQAVLEGLGWDIYRIWSTDWFSNRTREVEKLLNEIDRLVSKYKQNRKAEPKKDNIIDFDTQKPVQGKIFSNDEEIKQELIKLREEEINQKFPDVPFERNLLRPEILNLLIKNKPQTKEEFFFHIPEEMRSKIDGEQFKEYLPIVLEKIEDLAT